MKYLYLVYDDRDSSPPHAWTDWAAARSGSRVVFAAQLATMPDRRLSAVCLVDAHDLNAAIQLASRCPGARSGCIEIRPCRSRIKPNADLQGENPMKYLCMVYLDRESLTAVPDSDCIAFGNDAVKAGRGYLVAEALQPVETATTLRVRNGQLSMFDGPFAETKEQLAGFYLIEAADLDEAIAWAARIPPARTGSIEVRPVRTLVGDTGLE